MGAGSLSCMYLILVEQVLTILDPSFARSGEADPVDTGLTSSCCFGGELGWLSG